MTSGPPRKTDGLVVNALRVFASEGLTVVTQIATGILTARLLGPHDRGLYSLLLMIPKTLETLLKLGVAPANVYMICRQKTQPSHIASNSLVLAFGLGAIALVAVPFRDLLGETLLGGVHGWYLTAALSVVPLYILSAYLTSILHALNQFAIETWQTVVIAFVRLFATFVVLVVLQRGLLEAFLAHLLVGVFATAWLLISVSRLTSASFRPNLDVALRTIRFGLRSHGQTLVTALHLRLDHFLIALFLDPSQVAFYTIAVHIAEIIGGIHRPISIALYPRLAAGSEARGHTTTLAVCRHVLFLESIAVIGLLLGSRFMIGLLYGPSYLPAVQPLFIILPGAVMVSLFNLLGRNFMSRDRQEVTIAAGAAGLVLNIVLNVVLIPRLGISGAALASTTSYTLATLILLLAFRRDSRISLLEFVRMRKSDLEVYTRLVTRFVVRPVAI